MHRKDMIQMVVVIAVLVVAFFLAQKYLFPASPPPVIDGNGSGNKLASNEPPANKPAPPTIEDNTPSTEVKPEPTSKDIQRGFKVIAPADANIHKLANERLTAEFSDRGAVLHRLTFIDADGKPVYLHTPDNPVDAPEKPLELLHPLEEVPDLLPMALVLDKNDEWRNTSRWEVVEDAPQPEKGKSITFRFPPSRGFEYSQESDGTVIYKTITLLPDTYRFDIKIRIENKGSKGAEKVVGMWGPVGMTNDAARNSAEHSRIALYASTDSKRYIQFEDSPTIRALASDVEDLNADLEEEGEEVHDWVSARKLDDVTDEDRFLVVHGTRTQWFIAFIAADPDNRDQRWSGQVLPIKGNDQNAATSLIAPKLTIPAGEQAEVQMRFYAGPRDKERLSDAWLANPPADEAIKLQWTELATSGFWDVIATPLIWILRVLTGLVGPGLAIILLTLIVRFGLSPLSYRGQKSMATYTQKMKVVKPKLDAIKEKYEGKKGQDAQLKMLTETRAAMKEHNVGMLPLGGCLPMLIQLPIFIGLYRAFGNAFFLRQADFLWIHDLSLPDATIPISTYLGDSWLGFLAHSGWLTFNLLPMMWILLSIVQFKLQPKPDDPQQASMQKQMAFLFPLMGLMFYGYASGFAFYFIISSIYSISESKMVKRALIKQGVMPDPKKKPKVADDDKPEYHGAS
ncbi:MAG: YidC/Oxa1 family insertase periplasmic-domain containing protein [Planctomycetes bacterium]|nr:YidC/Oxa1 family insertase periplasmic-domain containing protein [Planctomycetota bacterium]